MVYLGMVEFECLTDLTNGLLVLLKDVGNGEHDVALYINVKQVNLLIEDLRGSRIIDFHEIQAVDALDIDALIGDGLPDEEEALLLESLE